MYKASNMSRIPNLPLGNYYDQYPSRTKMHRSQTLGYFNGYAVQKRQQFKDELSEQELNELINYTPTITYPQTKNSDPGSTFVPGYVAWDKKVLRFKAWFKETVLESALESYRVRPVEIFYYLIDDSMAVVEPTVENSGMQQGKLVVRHRLPKNAVGDLWMWKDLNVGMDIAIYGRVFHIYDCDPWTKEFLESEGYEVNPPERCPDDPYTKSRNKTEAPKASYKPPTDAEKLKKFLELDRKVLRFYCVWDDRDTPYGDVRKIILHYYLANDTIEIREVHRSNDGRDPFPLLMSRQKVTKDPKETLTALTSLGAGDQEPKDYFTPRDFFIGQTIEMYGRRFLIYECDEFTKAYYWKNFGLTDFTPIKVDKAGRLITEIKAKPSFQECGDAPMGSYLPEYKGYGTLEDSLGSVERLVPQPPRKDIIKLLENDGIVLRYQALMDSPRPEDKDRRFVISYRLADDLMSIFEPPAKNSGFLGGRFLERSRVAKPGSTPENPHFYGPQDFYIGAVIDVFRHRFVITNADEFVLNYMEQHPGQFPEEVVRSVKEKLKTDWDNCTAQKHDAMQVHMRKPRGPAEMRNLIQEVKGQLKKLAITGSSRKDRVFLGVDISRHGYVTRENIREMCIRQLLPCDREITDAIAKEIGQDPDHITLEEFRRFLETE